LAILTPLTLTILSASVPEHRRGTVIGARGGIGSLGAALGPVVGGALTATTSWQWIFWLNVSIGLLLLPAAYWRLAESYGPRRPWTCPASPCSPSSGVSSEAADTDG
jgi:MFS family permease